MKPIQGYEVFVLQANGPDDCEWDSRLETMNWMEAIRTATALHDKGHTVKIYDPFLQHDVDFRAVAGRA